MRIKKLPQDIFLKTFQLVPRVAVSLFIVDNKGKVLLTKRKKEPGKDFWHLPGSFLLRGETLAACAKRVAKDELGFDQDEDLLTLAGVFDNINGDPRGHVVDLIYKSNIKDLSLPTAVNDTKEVAFFERLPINLFFHKDSLRKLGFA